MTVLAFLWQQKSDRDSRGWEIPWKLFLICPELSPCVLLEVRTSSPDRKEEVYSLPLVPTHCYRAAFWSVFFLLCFFYFINMKKVDHSVLLLKLDGRMEFS